MNSIFQPGAPTNGAHLGGKAGALAALHEKDGIHIPAWFVLLPEAGHGRAAHDSLDPNARTELDIALARLCPGDETVAVRSSAPEEDGARTSFAGQFESFLFVQPEDVMDRVHAVRRSALNDRPRAYRERRKLSAPSHPPAVLIQRMVRAEISGVAFGIDPVGGDARLSVVSAVGGVGASLVNGECDADTWHVDAEGRIEKRHPMSADPLLTDDQIRAVATLARQCGAILGRPQDIEWAIEEGVLYLLQSRPITTLPGGSDTAGRLTIWDNSNIVESYSGVTTPLTFSFARRAYEGVYREFCRLLAVPASRITAHDSTFKGMLGLVRGRIYYNLLNWYRVLALLPGFKINRPFMEQMMGVKESVPDEILPQPNCASIGERLVDGWHLTVTLIALIGNHLRLPGTIRAFRQRLDEALAPPPKPFETMTLDELAAAFLSLERKLLTRWDAPLLNDFLAMIFFGVLRRLSSLWLNDADGTLQNGLLCRDGGMVSSEPARRIRELARLAAQDPGFAALLREGGRPEILGRVGGFPEFQSAYERYLHDFGERCLDELKLESLTLRDDPLPLLRAVGQLTAHLNSAGSGSLPDATHDTRDEAETALDRLLAHHPLRRRGFDWVLRHARARVRERENLRFERTRLFGRVRQIFVAFGRRLQEQGHLHDPRDIFHLEVDELLGYLHGSVTCSRLNDLAALRKAEFDEYRHAQAPPNRFVTRGPVHNSIPLVSTHRPSAVSAPGSDNPPSLQGLGCCPGLVRGPVRKVIDPRNAVLRPGEILVAERTDPGWVLWFPAAAGLLVERGSLLSHSAIVARELQIPTVVSVPGLMDWLREGDWIELNGRTGLVTKIDAPQSSRPATATQPKTMAHR